MRTPLIAATAAALSALAVTVAGAAFGGGAHGGGDADVAALRACLADHGVTVPEGDGAALKRWIIGTHTSAETDALAACGVAPAIKAGAPCDPRQPGGHASRPPGPGDKPGAGPAKPTGTQTSPST